MQNQLECVKKKKNTLKSQFHSKVLNLLKGRRFMIWIHTLKLHNILEMQSALVAGLQKINITKKPFAQIFCAGEAHAF